MSRKPYPEGATKLIRLARRIGELETQVPELCKHAIMAMQVRDAAEKKLSELKNEFREHLDSMDCDSTGNFGWEGRVGWLLGEVVRQIDAEKPRQKRIDAALMALHDGVTGDCNVCGGTDNKGCAACTAIMHLDADNYPERT